MVSQMKASVRHMNTTPMGGAGSSVAGSIITNPSGAGAMQIDGSSYIGGGGSQSSEPELIRYKATVPSSADIF
jgi:hypothetical protein